MIPDQKATFTAVRVPHAQAAICSRVVVFTKNSPQVHYVRPKKTVNVNADATDVSMAMEESQVDEQQGDSAADDSAMDTDSTFSYCTDYDEDLDYEFFFDEMGSNIMEMNPSEWNMKDVPVEFQWMKVDPARIKESESPFFDLP